jgi:hypothetical protein
MEKDESSEPNSRIAGNIRKPPRWGASPLALKTVAISSGYRIFNVQQGMPNDEIRVT